MREPEQREARLRFASQFTRGAIGLLRLRKLATQSMDLGLLIESGARRPAVAALGMFTRAAGFSHRVQPCSLQLHDLSTMHETRAAERDHFRLLFAHARKRAGPLAGAAQRIHLSAGIDHAAVHQSRHDGRQLTCDDGEHRLVQTLQTNHDVALLDEHAALQVTGRCSQVRVLKTLADLDRLACSRIRCIGMTLAQLLLGEREQQVAPLDALLV